MESGKGPGIDGRPGDFYKSFWSELGEDLLGRAVLTLLPKKGDLILIAYHCSVATTNCSL